MGRVSCIGFHHRPRPAGLLVMALMTGAEGESGDSKLHAVSRAVVGLLRRHPEGLDINEIKELLQSGADQMQLDRRVRDIRKHYALTGAHVGKRYVYKLGGRRDAPAAAAISGRLRAEVLNLAKGRCQMCGQTVTDDGVKLQVDHKIPQAWGGLTLLENLWALCAICNNGKRDHFTSYDPAEMAELLGFASVHQRIAHLLKMHIGAPVESNVIEFVANATERQEDWHKRLRELRYPVIGLQIRSGRYRTPQGFTRSTYTLLNWRELPRDHEALIRAWEKPAQRAKLKLALGMP